MNLIEHINWEKVNHLIPVVIQHFASKQVLMLGYMNPEALQNTMNTNTVHFFSRTKQRIWKKGETSGNILTVKNIELDCDQDTLLITADPKGPTCHKGTPSCFSKQCASSFSLRQLFTLLNTRKESLPEKSYSTKLFTKPDFALLKFQEECEELRESIHEHHEPKRITEEACDVLFHLSTLLVKNNISIDQIETELFLRNSEQYSHKSDAIHRN